jgi:hypothetical protein
LKSQIPGDFREKGVKSADIVGFTTISPRTTMPRATTEARAERDAWILRLFISGLPYREIGRHQKVNLSAKAVGNVINTQLAHSNPRDNDLAQFAGAIHVERLEIMLRAVWPKALGGDLKAIMQVLRVLRAEAKFYGLDGGHGHDNRTLDPDLDDEDWESPEPMNGFEKDTMIADLREQGWPLRHISAKVGMSVSGVSRALTRIGDGRPGRDSRDT